MQALLRRRIGLYIIAAAVIAALVYGFMPGPVRVEAVRVKRGPMRVTVDEEGRTRVIDRFIISAPVAGFARRISLDAGDAVKKGETVAELEPLRSPMLDPRSRAGAAARAAAAKAALEAAKEKVRAAEARAGLAKKELERLTRLFNDNLVTREQVDRAEAAAREADAVLRSAVFAADVARYKMEAVRTALEYSGAVPGGRPGGMLLIKSPVSGRVLRIHHKSEGVVREGQALIEIGDTRALEVEVDVLSADAVKIRPGTPVIFKRWGGGTPLKGRVRVVEPAGFTRVSALGVEEQRTRVISDIVSPYEEWRRLGDAYRVEAAFILWEDDNVLQVPASALFRYKEGWAVFVFSEGRARLREVRTGHRNGLTAEVVSGLAEGDMVITHPGSSVRDGMRVRLRR